MKLMFGLNFGRTLHVVAAALDSAETGEVCHGARGLNFAHPRDSCGVTTDRGGVIHMRCVTRL